MSRLPSWAEEGATAEELRLVEAARRERPAPEARLRALIALGVGGPSNGGPPTGGAAPVAVRAARTGMMAKVALLIVCGGGAVVGIAWLANSDRPGRPGRPPAAAEATTVGAPIAPAVEAATVAGPAASEAVEPAADPVAAGVSSDPRRPPHATRRHSLRSAPLAPPPSAPGTIELPEARGAASTLAAEVAALERAQAALAAQDAPGALYALDHYEATFPSGRLAREETVLRVQALLARGDTDSARALAERFFAAHPDSSYARRVRDLLHDAGPGQKK